MLAAIPKRDPSERHYLEVPTAALTNGVSQHTETLRLLILELVLRDHCLSASSTPCPTSCNLIFVLVMLGM